MALHHGFYRLDFLVGLLLFLQNPSMGLGETLQDHRESANDKYTIKVTKEEADPTLPGKIRYIFTMVEKDRDRECNIVLDSPIPLQPLEETHVDIRLLDEHTLIQTQWQGRPIYPASVSLLDSKTCQLLDEFACYSPVVSPNSKYIVYKRFFALHELPEYQDNVVLVYDLTRSATDNRLSVEKWGWNPVPWVYAGIPIYPPVCAREGRYRRLPDDDPKELGGPTSPILWRGDDEIVFLTGRYDGCHIVRIDLKKGPLNPSYYHGPVLSPTECVKPGYELKAKQQLPFAFHASGLIWDGSDAVIVKPNWGDHLKPEIRVLIP